MRGADRARRLVGVLALAAAALVTLGLAAGCGDDDEAAGGSTEASSSLTVYAAASLTDVFPTIEPSAEYNFAASDTLATQIREGAPADVYAAANTRLPDELSDEGLVDQPVTFATNRLVLLVEKENPKDIRSVQDLSGEGVTFVWPTRACPSATTPARSLPTSARPAS